MIQEPFRTESLDLAAWLMAHGLNLADFKKVASGRHIWIFEDPKGDAEQLSTTFANSIAADVLDKRKRLITITRSGHHDGQRQRG